jgi:pimeloyl-ACP methyl ester carboxylesterase
MPAAASFTGPSGNRLGADVFGDAGPPLLLLHGGGQTRHAWRTTGGRLARAVVRGAKVAIIPAAQVEILRDRFGRFT